MGKQASQYDKIFKENIEAVIPSLMQNVLGIRVAVSEELPDDIQHTKERKPDVLKRITDVQGNTFVLQIEFQVANEVKMVYRMAEYYVMLERKYSLPVEQFVIFLGAAKPAMPTRLNSKHLAFDFSLISFVELDYHIFLKSNQPEEIVFGVLANFKGESPAQVLEHIIHRIEETSAGDFALKRYFSQLRVLAQLRNLGQTLKDLNMISIAEFVSIEKDAFYMIGREHEKEARDKEIVGNLLKKLNLSFEQIADIVGVSVEFVQTVKEKLASDK